MWSNDMCSNRLKNLNFRVHTKFKEVNTEYLCNTNVVSDKNIILNIENLCYDKFKEKWYNDSLYSIFRLDFGTFPTVRYFIYLFSFNFLY